MRQNRCEDSVMKTTLIVIQNEADHADAKGLVEKLMGSSDPQDGARMVAQARLVEAYERSLFATRLNSIFARQKCGKRRRSRGRYLLPGSKAGPP
jgi:hypothetical protein